MAAYFLVSEPITSEIKKDTEEKQLAVGKEKKQRRKRRKKRERNNVGYQPLLNQK
jgi:hypothetical protein